MVIYCRFTHLYSKNIQILITEEKVKVQNLHLRDSLNQKIVLLVLLVHNT